MALEYLHIKNLALIVDMELEFGPGMNVLTGETGAGKSFILKALNFIMGERLGTDMIRPGAERAGVEALFTLPSGELVLRRELMAETGRSRLYINDHLSSQEPLRELRPSLMLHTSQHGQQKLLQQGYQAALVDDRINRPDLLSAKESVLQQLRKIRAERESLEQRARELSERRELLELHLKEIEKVNPEPGEEEHLEKLRSTLRDAERRKEHYEKAFAVLRGNEGPGLFELLHDLERELEVLSREDENMLGDLEAAGVFHRTLEDIERRLRRPPSLPDDMDPETIEARLYELAQLKRKLRRSLPEILSLRDEIQQNLSFLDACSLDIRQAARQEKKLTEELAGILAELNKERRAAGASFCTALEKELAGLGFSEHVRVGAVFTPHELLPGCTEDRIRLLWAPNPGQQAQPLDRIASGGELSRFLLAVVSLQANKEEATLIFDEVDAGVGGITLNRVADRLTELAERRQMILITHWPQLAARADRHFRVVKEVVDGKTFTSCTLLDDAQRKIELARMAGIEST